MTKRRRGAVTILMADDDEDDCLFVRDALNVHPLPKRLHFVGDGEDLMNYLRHRSPQYTDCAVAPRPDLILLDLNMPIKDGRQALKEIKSDPGLQIIPVIILTTSREQQDIRNCYELGANSFIIKPRSFEGLIETMHALIEYWFDKALLPRNQNCT